MTRVTRFATAWALMALAAQFVGNTQAEDWPQRPVRIVVITPPGGFPDFAGSENPRGFAMEIEPDEPAEREIEIVHAVVRSRNFAIEREEEGECVLRHRVRRISGHARDREAKPSCDLQIDVVESGAAQRDVLHP